MESLFICNLIAGLLILIFGFVFCYFDTKNRRVPLLVFNSIFGILFVYFGITYIWLMLTDSFVYGLIVATAFGLPFLLWYFAKGKFGAVDARWMSIIMLLVPSLYYQFLFVLILIITTLVVVFVSKFVTKTYNTFDKNGEQRYAPEMIAIMLSYVITLIVMGLLFY